MKKLLLSLKKNFIIQKRKIVSPSRLYEQLQKITQNHKLIDFIVEKALLCQPENVHICDGSEEEFKKLCNMMVNDNVIIPLQKRENSFLAFSDPKDVIKKF
jgi:phosphoenolpyruvate carboxykinase (GTP)